MRPAIFVICFALGLLSCNDSENSRDTVHGILRSLSQEQDHPDYAGNLGVAVETLVKRQQKQSALLTIDVRDGDADVGDGSCQFHVLVSSLPTKLPFIGIRMKLEKDGWHIAGYWTPIGQEHPLEEAGLVKEEDGSR